MSDKELIARLAFVDFDGARCLDYLNSNPNANLDERFVQNFAPQVFVGINKLCFWLDDLKKWKYEKNGF